MWGRKIPKLSFYMGHSKLMFPNIVPDKIESVLSAQRVTVIGDCSRSELRLLQGEYLWETIKLCPYLPAQRVTVITECAVY